MSYDLFNQSDRFTTTKTQRPALAGRINTQRAAGMTLVELLLAMSVTAMITLAAGGMLTAVTYGAGERTDLRGLVVRQELISHRLAAAIRASRQVLDSDRDQLVLWVSDTNNDQVAQLSEVRWIEYDSDDTAISCIKLVFPSNWTPEQISAVDKDYVTGSSRSVQTAALRNYLDSATWADQISDWLVSPGRSSVSQSTLVSYRVTFTLSGKQPQTVIGAAALRSQ